MTQQVKNKGFLPQYSAAIVQTMIDMIFPAVVVIDNQVISIGVIKNGDFDDERNFNAGPLHPDSKPYTAEINQTEIYEII